MNKRRLFITMICTLVISMVYNGLAVYIINDQSNIVVEFSNKNRELERKLTILGEQNKRHISQLEEKEETIQILRAEIAK